MDMQTVDLTLAVNYLPACGCLVRLILLMLALAMVPAGDEILGGYLAIAAALYLDRTLTHKIIFDGNAILMAVFFANTHAVIRAATSTMRAYPPVMGVGHLFWSAGCTILIADPPLVRQALENRKVAGNKLILVTGMLVTVVVTAYFQSDLEPIAIRACRALAFTLLAFAWIYMIGIHSNQGVGHLKESSWQFITCLAPVLYAPLWLAVLFCPAAVWALVMHQRSRQKQQSSGGYQYAPLLPVTTDDTISKEPSEPPPIAETTPAIPQEDPETQQMQELLRQAKQALAGGGTYRARHPEGFRPEG